MTSSSLKSVLNGKLEWLLFPIVDIYPCETAHWVSENYMDVILSIESVLEQRNCRLNGSWSECDVKQRWTISLPILVPLYTSPFWVLLWLLTCPLTPSPSYLSHTLTSTHTHHQHISTHRHLPHCIQAGSGNPTAQKTYIKHFSFRKLRPVSLLPFIAKTLERVVFNQVLIVSFTEQQTGR